MKTQATSVKIPANLVAIAKQAAKRENRSLSNWVGTIIREKIEENPNAVTIKAMRDTDAGIGLEAVTLEQLSALWDESEHKPKNKT